MNSSRPYLLPALLEWIVDSGCTPHLVISTDHPEVKVPEGHASDNQIVLNISPTAVANFELTREYVFFQTRFQGVPREIYAPLDAVLGIFARENGEGMAFSPDAVTITAPAGKATPQPSSRPRPVAPAAGVTGKGAVVKGAAGAADGTVNGVNGKDPADKPPVPPTSESQKKLLRPALRLVRNDEESNSPE